ncbi:MAG: class I SAM-dependent methyltransferase [Deltaproteobacteria bacterium]|nr:class I SAM-dependent methyltransferase [Deltaproteobacteria bacterium]
MSRLRRLAASLLLWPLGLVPDSILEGLISQAAARRAGSLPADQALRFLFRLEAALYSLEGPKAVEYGGGLHPKHRHLAYHDFFVNRVRAGERVLDLGCGQGALAFDLAAKAGAQVVGIDLAEENIAAARQSRAHPQVEYLAGDARQDLPAGSFEVVVLSNILEHLPRRPEFLRRLAGATQARRFLIRVPLFERDLRVPLKKELGLDWRLDSTHQVEYSVESFAQEMAEAGLEVVHQEIRWGEIWAEARS